MYVYTPWSDEEEDLAEDEQKKIDWKSFKVGTCNLIFLVKTEIEAKMRIKTYN